MSRFYTFNGGQTVDSARPAAAVTPDPLPDPFAESRPVRTYRAWVDEADPPRKPMTTGEKVAFVFVVAASALVVLWGICLAIGKFTGA